jgi:hypothetical protein
MFESVKTIYSDLTDYKHKGQSDKKQSKEHTLTEIQGSRLVCILYLNSVSIFKRS